MRRFRAQAQYQVRGHRSFAVINDETFEKESSHLIGETVKIDDKEYKVKAVGTWCLATIRAGSVIDLLVEND